MQSKTYRYIFKLIARPQKPEKQHITRKFTLLNFDLIKAANKENSKGTNKKTVPFFCTFF